MKYQVSLYKSNLPLLVFEAPFAQMAAKNFAEKFKLNDKTLVEVKNEIGSEVFEINNISMTYVRNVHP